MHQSNDSKARLASVVLHKKSLIVLFLLLCLGVLFQSTLLSLHLKWTQWDGAYSHGYILIAVCLACLFIRLSEFPLNGRIVWPWAFLLFIPSILWGIGYTTQIEVVSQLALPLFIACLILPWFGLSGLRRAAAPIALLFLAIPIWEVLLPVLRSLTAYVATFGVRVLGIPAFIDGFSFSLPYGTVVIAGSCAGLGFLLMALTLASLNSLYRAFAPKEALMSIALLVVLSVIGNWFRVFSLILIAYYSQMQSPLVADHGQFGWWIFSGLFVVYLLIIRSFPENTVQSKVIGSTFQKWRLGSAVKALVISLLGIGLLPFWLQSDSLISANRYQPVRNQTLDEVPAREYVDDLKLGYTGYDKIEIFRLPDSEFDLHLGRLIYTTQKQGKELISDGQQVTKLSSSVLAAIRSSYGSVNVELVTKGRAEKLLIWQFMLGRKHSDNALQGKWFQFTEKMQGRSAVALWFAELTCESRQCVDEYKRFKNPDLVDSLIEPLLLYPAQQ